MTTDEKVDEILQIVSGMKPSVDKHDRALFGNGQLGLTERLTIVETKQSDCIAVKGFKRLNTVIAIQIIMCGVAITSAIIAYVKS